MSEPQVAIDLGRIERNARTIVESCALSGIKMFGVTKGIRVLGARLEASNRILVAILTCDRSGT